MLRTLALAGGFAGAMGLSQFPEFSQQYYQRLSGAVDELRVMTIGFDLSAKAAGLTRDQALGALGDNAFETNLRDTMATSLKRYDRLAGDQARLRDKTVMQRLASPWSFTDPDLIRRTWADFKPALPLTFDGLMSAAIGFALGWGVLRTLFAGLWGLARRLIAR